MTQEPDAAHHARRPSLGHDRSAFDTSFYDRPTARVARDLLGAILETRTDGVTTSGRIVEVEAYLGPHDPACHAVAGLTTRNRQLHGPPGTAYVYRIYGLHWCVNAVTQSAGIGSAVLLRALAPVVGVEVMRRRRRFVADRELTNGPGKLCQALGIEGGHDGTPLDGTGEGGATLLIYQADRVPDARVIVTPRIGITQAAEWPLRFVVANEPHVSRTPTSHARCSLAESRAWLRERALR